MSQERKIMSVPVSTELKADLDLLAEDDHRPTANYTRLVLEQHVKEQREARPQLFAPKAHAEPAAA
jgi:predicted DNA-binding protein